MKKIRIEDRGLLNRVKMEVCTVGVDCSYCGNFSDPDHITTRGAGGGDVPDNVMPLCRRHHNERHAKGIFHMIEEYFTYRVWLERMGRVDILEKYEQARSKGNES